MELELTLRRKNITALYRRYKRGPINLAERLVIYLRLHFSSYEIIESYVPASGRIMDLGCGFGTLTLYLALSSRERRIRGIDISHRRLRIAESASAQVKNVAFECADLLRCSFDSCNCILLIDVIHYLPVFAQNALLGRCYEYLKPGGKLLVRDSNKDKKIRHLITRCYETIMTKSGFTAGEMLCFRSFVELTSYLESLGFLVDVLPMWYRTPFADTLLVCTKVGS